MTRRSQWSTDEVTNTGIPSNVYTQEGRMSTCMNAGHSTRDLPLQDVNPQSPKMDSTLPSTVLPDRPREMSRLPLSVVLEMLKTNPECGLTSKEAYARQLCYGTNELSVDRKEPMYMKFLDQFKNPLILLLLFSAGISVIMGELDDACSITLAILIVITVAFIQEWRSEKTLEALNRLVPPVCNCVRDGRILELPASELVPGDIIRFAVDGCGRIPADARLIEAVELLVDESNLTGETKPRKKRVQEMTSSGDGDAHVSCKPQNLAKGEESSPTMTFGPSAAPIMTNVSSSLTKGMFSAGMNSDAYALNAAERGEDRLALETKTNMIFMGTLVCNGYGSAVVIATGERSEFGRVFHMMKSVEEPKTPLQMNMDLLGKQLSIMSLGVVTLILLIGWIQGRDLIEMFTIGVSLAVAAIPEGLPIVVTVTLALGVIRMARRQVIVKKLPSVESLGSVNVICVDKTGTLTYNKMRLTRIYTVAEDASFELRSLSEPIHTQERIPIPGTTIPNIMPPLSTHCERNPLIQGVSMSDTLTVVHPTTFELYELNRLPSIKLCLWVGNLCNNGHLDVQGYSHIGQPTELAFLVAAQKLGLIDQRLAYERVSVIPFTSEQKWMAVGCRRRPENATFLDHSNSHGEPISVMDESKFSGFVSRTTRFSSEMTFTTEPLVGEVWYFAKGALEVILPKCRQVYAGPKDLRPLTPTICTHIQQASSSFAAEGLRVLSLAYGRNIDELIFVGLVGIHDPPRVGVADAIRQLMYAGIRVVMITGDARETAAAIAQQLNLCSSKDENAFISGRELQQLDATRPDELYNRLAMANIIYRAEPRDKLSIIHAYQEMGYTVAMTGDGVNDALALKRAHIGIAMGVTGTDVSKEAAHMILLDDNFGTLLAAIEEGKSIFHNIKHFLRFQLSTSMAALALVALCTLAHLPNPLNAMQILWINIIMDGPPAQSLGVEPVDPNVMRKPPRNPRAPILTWHLLFRAMFSASVIVTGTMYMFRREITNRIASPRDTTIAFTTFVFFDMFNAMACRSEKKSLFTIGVTRNKMLLVSIACSVIGQLCVIYIPFLQNVFQTEALHLTDLSCIVLVASTVLILDEIIKFLQRSGVIALTRNTNCPTSLVKVFATLLCFPYRVLSTLRTLRKISTRNSRDPLSIDTIQFSGLPDNDLTLPAPVHSTFLPFSNPSFPSPDGKPSTFPNLHRLWMDPLQIITLFIQRTIRAPRSLFQWITMSTLPAQSNQSSSLSTVSHGERDVAIPVSIIPSKNIPYETAFLDQTSVSSVPMTAKDSIISLPTTAWINASTSGMVMAHPDMDGPRSGRVYAPDMITTVITSPSTSVPSRLSTNMGPMNSTLSSNGSTNYRSYTAI